MDFEGSGSGAETRPLALKLYDVRFEDETANPDGASRAHEPKTNVNGSF